MTDSIPSSEAQRLDQDAVLLEIARLDRELARHFQAAFTIDPTLTRALVSFQANKARPFYRWYKYKEAFSAALVEYLFRSYGVRRGVALDPFAGSGTALFVASEMGIDAEGIELLPIGQRIIAAKQLVDAGLAPEDLQRLKAWAAHPVWAESTGGVPITELRITRGAYPPATQQAIGRYLDACQRERPDVRDVLIVALLSVLESVSYTRKDGQYLRWDYRSGRRQGKKAFDKGVIPSFEQAIGEKIQAMLQDIAPAQQQTSLFPVERTAGAIHLHYGSCLEIMPRLESERYDALITSPPYCNRYDYTRTYALELALLGIEERGLTDLRQTMLSCTVENRAKDLARMNPLWQAALAVAEQHPLLQQIRGYLERLRLRGELNNAGIPRMVRGYFSEMACVIADSARVLKSNAPLFMVNDNVRYAGASVSVDMILSDFAEQLGFAVEKILVLPGGKGNSSQQMGVHGRDPLRKCVYIWRKR